jgi:hypothetical protein
VTFGDLATLDLGTGPRSVLVRFKTDAIGAQQDLFSKRSNTATALLGWETRIEASGKLLGVMVQDSGAGTYRAGTGATVLSADTWYDALFVYAGSGGDWTIYLNGVAEAMTATGTAGAINADNTVAACIGTRAAGAANMLTGAVNEVIVYSRALTAAEAAQLHGAGTILYERSYAKGNVVLEGWCVNRLGAFVKASHITTDDWWIQNLDSGTHQPLRITGVSVDMKAGRNALTIGEDATEEQMGLRIAELLALPETEVIDPETGEPNPHPWGEPGEGWNSPWP